MNKQEVIAAIVAAAECETTNIENPQWYDTPEQMLFLAWRESFLKAWQEGEKTLNQKAVAISKGLAGADADRVVFRYPLAYQQDLTGKNWRVRDMVYDTAPLWFAAYYNIALAVVETCPS